MTSGSIAVKIQYHVVAGVVITVIDDNFDLCSPDTGLTCPLPEGSNIVTFSDQIPSFAPEVSV